MVLLLRSFHWPPSGLSTLPKFSHMAPSLPRTQLSPHHRIHPNHTTYWRSPGLSYCPLGLCTCRLLCLVCFAPSHWSLLAFSRPCTSSPPLPHVLRARILPSAGSFPPHGDSGPQLLPSQGSTPPPRPHNSLFPAGRGKRESGEDTPASESPKPEVTFTSLLPTHW